MQLKLPASGAASREVFNNQIFSCGEMGIMI